MPEEVKKEDVEVTSWADNVAEEVAKRKRKVYVFEGMWTPSGFFHIGNARPEIFTPYAVKRALTSKGLKARQNLILDDFDAVRKIPQDLDLKLPHDQFIGFPCATAPARSKAISRGPTILFPTLKNTSGSLALN